MTDALSRLLERGGFRQVRKRLLERGGVGQVREHRFAQDSDPVSGLRSDSRVKITGARAA